MLRLNIYSKKQSQVSNIIKNNFLHIKNKVSADDRVYLAVKYFVEKFAQVMRTKRIMKKAFFILTRKHN